jgi:hypothetical protein
MFDKVTELVSKSLIASSMRQPRFRLSQRGLARWKSSEKPADSTRSLAA